MVRVDEGLNASAARLLEVLATQHAAGGCAAPAAAPAARSAPPGGDGGGEGCDAGEHRLALLPGRQPWAVAL